MPGRTYPVTNTYRYGFNGKENIAEHTIGLTDFGARILDSRIGRFLSLDPLKSDFAEWSPYVFALDNPIRMIDIDGLAPGDPLHHEFLTTVALDVYDAAKAKGASSLGALLVMSQASLESGYGKAAISNKDYNLFGVMGYPSKRSTSHGAVKDYTNLGKYTGAINDYFARIDKNWSTFDDVIKNEVFTADDIDKAFNTGQYYQFAAERKKNGKLAYNADDVDESKKVNNNKYGTHLFSQMRSFQKRFIASLDYQMNQNNINITALKDKVSKSKDATEISKMNSQIKTLEDQNTRFQKVKDEISKAKP